MNYTYVRPQTELEKEIDKSITKLVLPTMDELLLRLNEIKQKKQELRKEIKNLALQKQALTNKRNRVNKIKNIYDNQLNGDFSNKKLCRECLITYTNIIDKKEKDFIKDKDDYYELKLRKKQLEFNKLLLDIVKQNSLNEQKKLIEKKPTKKSFISNYSIPKQKSLTSISSITNCNNKPKNKSRSVTSNKINVVQKSTNLSKQNSIKSKYSGDVEDEVSLSVSKLIQNYSTIKDGQKTPISNQSTTLVDGLMKMKEITKETKSIENNLKEILDNIKNTCELDEKCNKL